MREVNIDEVQKRPELVPFGLAALISGVDDYDARNRNMWSV